METNFPELILEPREEKNAFSKAIAKFNFQAFPKRISVLKPLFKNTLAFFLSLPVSLVLYLSLYLYLPLYSSSSSFSSSSSSLFFIFLFLCLFLLLFLFLSFSFSSYFSYYTFNKKQLRCKKCRNQHAEPHSLQVLHVVQALQVLLVPQVLQVRANPPVRPHNFLGSLKEYKFPPPLNFTFNWEDQPGY